ncbi:MAG TPA: bifunctional DNA-formamidopyrimidine glycosylase/DNA-(apurinic or apyrimidinic site) lyase [Acidimicrobiales bacterium]|jgi:formamidopyrimidine-DNA glycosylase
MPELPEVETIRRELEPRVVGRELGEAWAFPHPKFLPALEAAGATIESVDRRGKYLLIGLHDARELVVHLGMTGSLQITPRNVPPDDPYLRAWWELGDDERLEFRDVRRFGRLAVVEPGQYLGTLAVQGLDALDPALTAEDLWQSVRSSRRALKTQLLSQRPLAGVGNIYADEALWLAKLNPRRRSITRKQAAELLEAVREVLTAGLDNGGTTLRNYRTVEGAEGRNQYRLACYGRAGQPCLRCETILRKTLLDGRATTWCPICQPAR